MHSRARRTPKSPRITLLGVAIDRMTGRRGSNSWSSNLIAPNDNRPGRRPNLLPFSALKRSPRGAGIAHHKIRTTQFPLFSSTSKIKFTSPLAPSLKLKSFGVAVARSRKEWIGFESQKHHGVPSRAKLGSYRKKPLSPECYAKSPVRNLSRSAGVNRSMAYRNEVRGRSL